MITFKVGDKVRLERKQENNWGEVGKGVVTKILLDPSTGKQIAIKYKDREWINGSISFEETIMIDAPRFRVRPWTGASSKKRDTKI